MALMLAWTNILIKEGLFDENYVQRYTTSFEELAAALSQYTPEWAATETDLPAGLIAETATEIGRHRPSACIHPGRHASWYVHSVTDSPTVPSELLFCQSMPTGSKLSNGLGHKDTARTTLQFGCSTLE